MRRREFTSLLVGGALWPTSASAQQPPLPVIGFFGSASPELWTERLRAFRDGLSETGYAEGKNVRIEYLWAHSQNNWLPALAADLVQQQVAVIVVLGNTTSALAAKAATSTIPIVARIGANPVDIGLIASLSQPGGNVTGVTTLGADVGPKQLELLRELIPGMKVFALLINPTNPALADPETRALLAAAHQQGLELHVLRASSDRDFEEAFATLKQSGAGALMIGADALFNIRNEQLANLALRSGVPAISPYKEFAEGGGLMTYGANIARASRQAGVYTGRILRGEKPANLPFQLPTQLEMVINLKTARQLGIIVPPALLARADEVIE